MLLVEMGRGGKGVGEESRQSTRQTLLSPAETHSCLRRNTAQPPKRGHSHREGDGEERTGWMCLSRQRHAQDLCTVLGEGSGTCA